MEIIFWITTIIFFYQGIYKIIFRKDYFNIFTYVFLGVYFPLFLYLLNWSRLIDKGISPVFYFIFSSLNVFIILANSMSSKTVNDKPFKFKIKKSKNALLAVNIIYIFLFLLENFLGSGYLLPAMHGVDIHTYSAPGISYFTNSLFTILLLNFLFWYKKKEKIYLFWILLFLTLPVIGKSARMQVVLSSVQLLSFGIFIYMNDKIHGRLSSRFFSKKRHKIALIVILLSSLLFLISLTEYRWGDYGTYQVSYSDSIEYTGPSLFKNVTSIYYGYFPLSFNNLNMNIKYKYIEPNYVGLYSYKALYFGVFRLHNIFDLNPYEPEVGKYVTTGSATVPTGFFDFYYDYGLLVFIPIMIGIIIYSLLKRNVNLPSSSISGYALYFFWVPLWFFMSFQNVIYTGTLLIQVIVLIFLINYFFAKDMSNTNKNKTLN